MKKPLLATLTAAVLALLSIGCSSNNGPAMPAAAMGEIQVVHLSPDAGPVDIWLDGAVALRSVPFQAISGYLSVEAGERRVQVTPAGASTPVVIDAVLPIGAGTATTVVATGLLSNGSLAPVVLSDDRSAGSQVQVRFMHASPDAPTVDIALAGGAVLIPNVAFQEASDYTTVPGGTYDLDVRLAGSMTVALPLRGVVLANGTNVTVFAVGRVSDGSLGALVAQDAP